MDWPALMRLGLGRLGLHPRYFWDLTPFELLTLLGVGPNTTTMTRAGLAELERALDQKLKGHQNGFTK